MANATLVDAEGRNIGQARLQQTPHGVLLKLELRNVPSGVHAVHVHEVGRCDAPTFESAGAHVASPGRQHGFLATGGFHAGDLPNIDVPATKNFAVEYFVRDVTLDAGAATLLDADGSAVVIHAGKDDYVTNPAGGSGDRIACGRIVR
jgi:superoxide dismutase, Cu-Zn family